MKIVSFNSFFFCLVDLSESFKPEVTHLSAEKLELVKKLDPWRNADSHGKKRVKHAGSPFTIKYPPHFFHTPLHMMNPFFSLFFFRCVGVWDTVGSFGLPGELSITSKKQGCPFGFPDRILGEHIERAYQALALNETRADFVSFLPTLKLFFMQLLV